MTSGSEGRLIRSKTQKVLGGVLGGMAEKYGWDVALVRIVAVLLLLGTGFFPVGLIYVIMWAALPNDPSQPPRPWWKVALVALGFLLGGAILFFGLCVAIFAVSYSGGGMG